jgi:hypothetical protein
VKLINFNARQMIEELTSESFHMRQHETSTQDNELAVAVISQTNRRTSKKKNKKRVKHFARSGIKIIENVREEEKEINSEKPGASDLKKTQTFDVTTSQAIIESCEQASAVNATSNDVCWICLLSWNEFVDLRLVIIPPCSHLACSSCLLKLLKTCSEKQKDGMGEFTYQFNCGICRLELDETIAYEAANQVLDRNLVASFAQFIATGSSKEERRERRQLIHSLLVDRFEYDVTRVENTLFNFIDIIGVDGSENLTPG